MHRFSCFCHAERCQDAPYSCNSRTDAYSYRRRRSKMGCGLVYCPKYLLLYQPYCVTGRFGPVVLCHTINFDQEALEKWPVTLIEHLLPRSVCFPWVKALLKHFVASDTCKSYTTSYVLFFWLPISHFNENS